MNPTLANLHLSRESVVHLTDMVVRPRSKPRPPTESQRLERLRHTGEMWLPEWRRRVAACMAISEAALVSRIAKGTFTTPQIRRVSQRVAFVVLPPTYEEIP